MRPAWVLLGTVCLAPGGAGLPSAVAAQSTAAERVASCRCPERSLADYYAAADDVLLMRVDAAEDTDGSVRMLSGVVMEAPWKLALGRSVGAGDPVAYRTATSSAACGVSAERGDVLAVFASEASAVDGLLAVDTCSGTRVYRAAGTGEVRGFQDVPARFVVSQLDALSGMDALSETVTAADGSMDTLLGLLDLEALAHGGNVPVHDEPQTDAPVVAMVEDYAQVESREVGYEVLAAMVFQRGEGWSKVRLTTGEPGWVPPESAGTWFPYAELPVRRLAYLTGAWSGHVWPDAGAGIPRRSAQRSTEFDQVSVEVHEVRLLGGVPWFRVDVLAESPCEGGQRRTTLSGWVPGYGTEGDPTVWYYSRGC